MNASILNSYVKELSKIYGEEHKAYFDQLLNLLSELVSEEYAEKVRRIDIPNLIESMPYITLEGVVYEVYRLAEDDPNESFNAKKTDRKSVV